MPSAFTLTSAATSQNPIIDIVMLHGLGGSATDTWVHVEGEKRTYWPALLGERLSSANVSIVGYPTSRLGKILGGTDLSLLTVAAGVADLLISHGLGTRPIFFIAHSLGGIVAKAVLRLCADSSDPRKLQLFQSVETLTLFGTPNSGASMGNVCRHLPGLTAMQAAELTRADAVLLELSQWFRGKAGNDKIRCQCFFETEAFRGLLVVDAASANPGVDGCDPTPVTDDHVGMVKLLPDHSAFTSVVAFIADTCASRQIQIVVPNIPDQGRAPPTLKKEYIEALFRTNEVRHLQVEQVDENALFVEPILYYEKTNSRITTIDQLIGRIVKSRAAIISGNDRSGKSLITKLLQIKLSEQGKAAVRLNGARISNADILALVTRQAELQYGETAPPLLETILIIDDFDECQLQDSIKERIISEVSSSFAGVLITSFTHSPSVLFTPTDRPDPELFEISPMGDEKLLELVHKWRSLGRRDESHENEKSYLATFELLLKIFSQTEVEKYPGTAINFLELIDSSSGTDINFSSYAACYETLITSHITGVRANWQNLDEARNFISHVAFEAYLETKSPIVAANTLNECLEYYRTNYFSSVRDLREIALRGFLVETETGYKFKEEYEWYFLCARHAANTLKSGDAYDSFLMDCTTNIFRKQYANMIVFMAYFNTDNMILSLLLDILDGLFSKAPSWTLSDEQKTLMLGLKPSSTLAIQSSTDANPNRARILRERVTDIIGEAEEVVAQYTLPFLNAEVGDSTFVVDISPDDYDADSYMNSLNALMRIHSVIGQILASRSGTFDSRTILDCITRMVQASGRYIALNHAISAVLIYDKSGSMEEVDRAYDNNRMTKEEKYQKVERIFSFWSVYLSQAGLARYLSHDHAIRALKMLAGRNENAEQYKSGHIPFNFTSVLIIASLYKSESLERSLFESVIEKYGENSAIIAFMRVAVQFYSYYMPLSIQDKQWLGEKLRMPVKRIEAQRQRAIFSGASSTAALRQKKQPMARRRRLHPPRKK